jgi:anthranilate phosphoribosyltransferase
MRQKAVRLDAAAATVLDTCGTGGDKMNTFNISTATAFVAAAAGITVAKHGNRAVTSKCGSADVLQALGVNIDIDPLLIEEAVQTIGIGFLFAQKLHPAMKYAAKPRKELGIRTIFNVLGPLTNPAGATNQLLGVYAPELTQVLADVLKKLGTKRAAVVHGQDGIDEVATTSTTKISELKDGLVNTYLLNPLDYFEDHADAANLAGGDPAENATIISNIFKGKASAARNIVALNSAVAIYVVDKAPTIAEALKIAEDLIDSGKAQAKLQELIDFTNQ